MNPWIPRIIVIILAVAFLPLLVSVVAHLIAEGVNSVGAGIQGLLAPFSMSGQARLEGAIRLCLYLVAALLLIKYVITARGSK